jgi:hypothetical protein
MSFVHLKYKDGLEKTDWDARIAGVFTLKSWVDMERSLHKLKLEGKFLGKFDDVKKQNSECKIETVLSLEETEILADKLRDYIERLKTAIKCECLIRNNNLKYNLEQDRNFEGYNPCAVMFIVPELHLDKVIGYSVTVEKCDPLALAPLLTN